MTPQYNCRYREATAIQLRDERAQKWAENYGSKNVHLDPFRWVQILHCLGKKAYAQGREDAEMYILYSLAKTIWEVHEIVGSETYDIFFSKYLDFR